MFLTVKEVKAATRKGRKSTCIRFLQDRKIPHDIDDNGWPIVHVSHIEKLHGLAPTTKPKPTPDVRLDHLRGRNGKAAQAQT